MSEIPFFAASFKPVLGRLAVGVKLFVFIKRDGKLHPNFPVG